MRSFARHFLVAPKAWLTQNMVIYIFGMVIYIFGGATKINSSFEDILFHGKSTWIAPKIMMLRFSMTSPKNEASRIVRLYAQDVFLLQKYSHVFE